MVPAQPVGTQSTTMRLAWVEQEKQAASPALLSSMAAAVELEVEQLTSESSPELVVQPEAVTAEATQKTATQERQTPVAEVVVQATTETSGLVEQAALALCVLAIPAHHSLLVAPSALSAAIPFTRLPRAAACRPRMWPATLL